MIKRAHIACVLFIMKFYKFIKMIISILISHVALYYG